MIQATVPEPLSISVDPQGTLRGTYLGAIHRTEVKVNYNGKNWATVPLRPADGTAGKTFQCDLPNVASEQPEVGEISVTGVDGELLTFATVKNRLPKRNIAGFPAFQIERLHNRPFWGIPYWSFDGARLTITGSHLPPGGDPSALDVEFGPGVAYKFLPSIESPTWEQHFWYWPNARFSDFQVIIDLAESKPDSDPFTFRFKHRKGIDTRAPEPYGRVWIPRDLGSVVGFPLDPSQLTRVQTWSDSRSVTLTGYNAFRAIAALLESQGVEPAGTTLMDWGCGHGRVARHFIREWTRSDVIGMDVDTENVNWASENLTHGKFIASPLIPPCPLPDGCIDALFSISVMTHLAPNMQRLWLTELARLLRPKGIALMSFGGPGAVAWSSVWNGPDYFDIWEREGIHAGLPDAALAAQISDPEYYRNVAQTHAYVHEHWSREFRVLKIIPEAIGNLDVAVLCKR